jgi:SpoVK/Ycf46/Vps4 family AAA+-type ATPase
LISALQTALSRLDQLIGAAAERASEVYGPEAARDSFRGLYLSGEGFRRALAQAPAEPLLWTRGEASEDFEVLARELDLPAFDLDVLLIAIAPELDLKYERLFGFLQDDVTRKRPTVDLALQLLCESAEIRLARRAHFKREAPLFARRLLRLVADPAHAEPPLLAHFLKPEPQALSYLTGQAEADPRLAAFCRLVSPQLRWEDTVLDAGSAAALARVSNAALFFEGPRGAGQAQAAEALARDLGLLLLTADLSRTDLQVVLPALFSEARVHNAVLFVEGIEEAPARLLESLVDRQTTPTIFSGPRSFPGWFPVSFHGLSAEASRRAWVRAALAEDLPLSPAMVETLSARLKLTPDQIRQTTRAAKWNAAWRGAEQVETRDLMAAARSYAGQDLAALARKVEVRHGWDDIVVPADTKTQLREICQRVEHRRRVLDDWGFDAKLSAGKGVNALFSGPSGSGKTMAAEILSNELELDAYRIDLSGVVSKYIGETEKNLSRIFAAAENANAILFFDEADALFGKRSEVRDSHDRYANIEISYLLQKMEEYSGIAILATNLKQNLDEAFVRRLTFSVHFPFPDEASRREIWKNIWPAGVPLADDVDSNLLARQFQLSGGNIRNVALAAAFLASERGDRVSLWHILHATRREYQKYGKQLQPADLLPDLARGALT